MTNDFSSRIFSLKKNFLLLEKPEDRYQFIIDLGRKLPPFPAEQRTDQHLVSGCQSTLYVYTSIEEGKVHFSADSDALISKGLAALLIAAYTSLEPKILLTEPPLFLQELGIFASLSPNRSHGLAHIYLKMKRDVARLL